MLSLAALALAAATPASTANLDPNASWWERITVTIAGDGKPQACVYQSSLRGGMESGCRVEGGAAGEAHAASAQDQYTKLTFERRFSPGPGLPSQSELHPGDTLVAGQVLAIAIDGAGAVKGCSVVANAGEKAPEYGCAELAAERFQASAAVPAAEPRRGFVTILVYGHSEHVA